MSQFSVLFICMGNLCRSPTAHAVFRQRIAHAGLTGRVRIGSAGTHAGARERADARARAHAARRGYALDDLRSRRVTARDFHAFDLLLAMDEDNLAHLRRHCPATGQHRLQLLTAFCQRHRPGAAVPDPYYSNALGFEHVLDLVEDACDGLLAHVQRQLLAASPLATF